MSVCAKVCVSGGEGKSSLQSSSVEEKNYDPCWLFTSLKLFQFFLNEE